MERHPIMSRDQALTSQDLEICEQVLGEVQREFDLANGSEDLQRAGAIIIELYREGVHDAVQLRALVFAARGKFV